MIGDFLKIGGVEFIIMGVLFKGFNGLFWGIEVEFFVLVV